MRPSVALDLHRDAVRALVAAHKVANPRVFGSVAYGEDTEESDLDLLVDAIPGTSFLDLDDLQKKLETLLGKKVDIVTSGGLSKYIRTQVLETAVPL